MFRNHCMLVLALSLSMPMAFAQGVYRNVGPDGKVTYSDSPAETSKEVKISQPRPTPAPKSEQIAAASSTSGSASERSPRGAKQAMGRDDTSSATPAPQKADRALEGAVIGVLGIEDLVLRAQEICNSTMPSASGKFSAATAGWKQRNADIVRRARQ